MRRSCVDDSESQVTVGGSERQKEEEYRNGKGKGERERDGEGESRISSQPPE